MLFLVVRLFCFVAVACCSQNCFFPRSCRVLGHARRPLKCAFLFNLFNDFIAQHGWVAIMFCTLRCTECGASERQSIQLSFKWAEFNKSELQAISMSSPSLYVVCKFDQSFGAVWCPCQRLVPRRSCARQTCKFLRRRRNHLKKVPQNEVVQNFRSYVIIILNL